MATRICLLLLLLLLVSCSAWGESVNDALPGRRIGRQLRIMNFRLDGLGSTLDFLPPWASTQVKEWFPALGGHTSGSQATGSEKEKPRSGSRWPSVHLSGDNLVVNGPKGALNLVLVPEVKESEDKEVEKGAHCTNKPPLGATCQEVVDFDSCSLPVLAANNICNELCGRCQTSTPAKDSNESTDQDSDKVKKDEDSSSGGDSEKTGDGDEKGEESDSKKDAPEEPSEGGKTKESSSEEQKTTDKEQVKAGDCQSLAEFLASRSDLSVTSSLFQNVGYPLLRAVLEDSFVGTVFIPDDGAFDKLASQIGLSKDQIINASPSFWDQIIDAHIVPGLPRRKFSEGQEFPTLSARWDIFVKKGESGGLQLESQSGFKAHIVEQDITACSSVIHVVDNIILPMSKEEAISSFKQQAERPSAGR